MVSRFPYSHHVTSSQSSSWQSSFKISRRRWLGLMVSGIACSFAALCPPHAQAAPAQAADDDANAPRVLQVNSLKVSPDGKLLVAGMNQMQGKKMLKRQMRLWDVETGQALQTVDGPNNMDMGVAFSPDGKLLAGIGIAAQDGSMTGSAVDLWSVPDGKLVHHLAVEPHEMVLGLAFAPDGKTLAGGSVIDKDGVTQGQVRLWDVGSAAVKKTISDMAGGSAGLTYSADGKWLAAPAQMVQGDKVTGSEVRVWNAATGQVAHTITIPKTVVEALAFTPDAKSLAVKAAAVNDKGEVGYNTIRLWEVATGKLQWNFDEVGISSLVQSIAFSGDGQQLVAGGVAFGQTVQNRVWVWRMTVDDKQQEQWNLANTWTPTTQNPDADDATCGGLVAALAPDAKAVAVGLGTGDVQLIDMQTGQVLRTFANAVE